MKEQNVEGQVWVELILGTRLWPVTSCCLDQAQIWAPFVKQTADFFSTLVTLLFHL